MEELEVSVSNSQIRITVINYTVVLIYRLNISIVAFDSGGKWRSVIYYVAIGGGVICEVAKGWVGFSSGGKRLSWF